MLGEWAVNISDLKVGDRVRAFHPHTLGVIHAGDVVKVGRKWVHVRFTVSGDRVYKLAPDYVEGKVQ